MATISIINLIKSIFKSLLVLSKINMIVLSFYYIINYNIFSVTLNVPSFLRSFFFIDFPLKVIESLNMCIMVIPSTVIIFSFYYPEKPKLQFLSNFCAIGGNIFSLNHLLEKGLLEESFKTFFFTVYNVPSLDTKIKLFSEFFNKSINSYTPFVKDTLFYQSFIQEQFNNNISTYIDMLKTLAPLDILPFSERVAEQLHQIYVKKIASLNSIDSTIIAPVSEFALSGKIFVGLGFALLTFAFAFLFYKTYQNAVLLKDVSTEMVDGSHRVTTVIKNAGQTDTLLSQVNDKIALLADGVDKINGNHVALSVVVSCNAKVLTDLVTRMQKLDNELDDFKMTSVNEPTLNGERLPSLILTLNHQIRALAHGNLDMNAIITNIQKNMLNIEDQVQKIAAERLSNSVINSNEKSLLAANAADLRWIEDAKAKMRDFDSAAAIKEIKSFVIFQTNVIREEMSQKIDNTLDAAKQTLKDNKAAMSREIKTVSQDHQQTRDRLTETIQNQSNEAVVIQKMNHDLTLIKQDQTQKQSVIDALNIEVNNIKTELSSYKTAVNSQVIEMQTYMTNMFLQIQQRLDEYNQYVEASIRLKQNITADNAHITAGTYTPKPLVNSTLASKTNLYNKYTKNNN